MPSWAPHIFSFPPSLHPVNPRCAITASARALRAPCARPPSMREWALSTVPLSLPPGHYHDLCWAALHNTPCPLHDAIVDVRASAPRPSLSTPGHHHNLCQGIAHTSPSSLSHARSMPPCQTAAAICVRALFYAPTLTPAPDQPPCVRLIQD
jgi:hypothetical protein